MIDFDEVSFIFIVTAVMALPTVVLAFWRFFARDYPLRRLLTFGLLAGVSWPIIASLLWMSQELLCEFSGIDAGLPRGCKVFPDALVSSALRAFFYIPPALAVYFTIRAGVCAIELRRS